MICAEDEQSSLELVKSHPLAKSHEISLLMLEIPDAVSADLSFPTFYQKVKTLSTLKTSLKILNCKRKRKTGNKNKENRREGKSFKIVIKSTFLCKYDKESAIAPLKLFANEET